MEDQNNTPEVTTESLQAAISIKDARIAELEGHLTEAGTIIADQKDTLAKSEQTIATLSGVKSSVPTVTVGDDVYAINAHSVNLNGTIIKAEHIVKDAELAQKLVDMGVGFLEKLEQAIHEL